MGWVDGFAPHMHHAATAVPVVALGVRARLRAYWSRLRHRGPDTVEGHRLLD